MFPSAFRSQIPKFLKYALSQKGKTIAELEHDKNSEIPGDASQNPYRNKPVWHHRLDLIKYIGTALSLSPDYWGEKRSTADFHNYIDQEISKLKKKKTVVLWSTKKHIGILRLEPPHQTIKKPTVSIKKTTIPQIQNEDALKRTFVSTLTTGRKANTYKFALARAILEHCSEHQPTKASYTIPYQDLASKFLKYYWHQECKYKIKQDFKTQSTPKVITAIRDVFGNDVLGDFNSVNEDEKKSAEDKILKTVFGHARSKTSLVVPKFQKIMVGKYAQEKKAFYDYDDDAKMIYLKPEAFVFFKNNYNILSRAVLAEWAKFLEKINGSLPRLVAKIDKYDYERSSLAKFSKIYLKHTPHCFYCCSRLERGYIHVDHFIPWSYIFEDEAWNLVLACQDCNCKKSNSLPQSEWQNELITRNSRYRNTISLLDHSLKIINTRRGWENEIKNHYTNCKEYGFNEIKMP